MISLAQAHCGLPEPLQRALSSPDTKVSRWYGTHIFHIPKWWSCKLQKQHAFISLQQASSANRQVALRRKARGAAISHLHRPHLAAAWAASPEAVLP